MPKNTLNKKITTLETTFADILVCKKNNFRPNIEVFIQKPENISQQALGTLVGIFEITDDSEDSSYIVNYLISIIKKEYYIKTKRGPLESFEAALHRVNLALTKLAEHGSIGWIGKINALLSVIEKNNIHLAQTGSAKALLIRENTLTNITENSSEIENHNSLKTFIDVISGRLEKNDKIILSTQDIFDIFSFEEIKKSALKFSSSEFIQFLRTALVNELEKASVLIIETKEKEIIKNIVPIPKNNNKVNVFSQTSFSKIPKNSTPKENEENIKYQEKQTIINEIKEDLKKESSEFINQKTGHIYIKEDNFLRREKSTAIDLLEESKEKISEIMHGLSLKNWKKYLPKIPRTKPSLPIKPLAANETEKATIQKISIWKEKIYPNIRRDLLSAKSLVSNKTKLLYAKLIDFLAKTKELKNIKEKESLTLHAQENNSTELSKNNFFEKISPNRVPKNDYKKPIESPIYFHVFVHKLKIVNKFIFEKTNLLIHFIYKFLPKFSKIRSIFSSLSNRQKIYTISILFLLFVVPYFIVKIQSKPKEITIPASDVLPTAPSTQPLSADKNVIRIENLNQIDLGKEILEIINLNNAFFAISSSEIIDLGNNQIYPIADNKSSVKIACGMDDLNLIFILNDKNQVLSWSPISKKFSENKLTIPENANISDIKTYLTYLYILDQKNNQIYRYPRATEGFGDKINWLKESLDLSQANNFAISEDLFLAQDKNIIKLASGKKQEFKLEETATPIKTDQIYTKINSQNIYVLDKTNSRIIKLDLSGNIVSEFYNPEISSATSFSINEETSLIYFSKEKYLKSFEAK